MDERSEYLSIFHDFRRPSENYIAWDEWFSLPGLKQPCIRGCVLNVEAFTFSEAIINNHAMLGCSFYITYSRSNECVRKSCAIISNINWKKCDVTSHVSRHHMISSRNMSIVITPAHAGCRISHTMDGRSPSVTTNTDLSVEKNTLQLHFDLSIVYITGLIVWNLSNFSWVFSNDCYIASWGSIERFLYSW